MATEADEFITVRQAAQEYNRTTETVRRWVWEGKVPAQKLGNQLLIKRSDLQRMAGGRSAGVGADQLEVLAEIEAIHERIRSHEAELRQPVEGAPPTGEPLPAVAAGVVTGAAGELALLDEIVALREIARSEIGDSLDVLEELDRSREGLA